MKLLWVFLGPRKTAKGPRKARREGGFEVKEYWTTPIWKRNYYLGFRVYKSSCHHFRMTCSKWSGTRPTTKKARIVLQFTHVASGQSTLQTKQNEVAQAMYDRRMNMHNPEADSDHEMTSLTHVGLRKNAKPGPEKARLPKYRNLSQRITFAPNDRTKPQRSKPGSSSKRPRTL